MQLNEIFSKKEKVRVVLILFLIFIGGCLEVIGIGIILPYLALLLSPEKIHEVDVVAGVYSMMTQSGLIKDNSGFFVVLTFLIIAFYWIKNLFFVLSLRFQINFNYSLYKRLSSNLLSYYLTEDYLDHINRNTSELIKNINQQTLDLIQAFLIPLLIFISECMIVLLLLGFLLILNPLSSLYVFTLLGLAVIIIFVYIRKRLHLAGEIISASRTQANKQVLQGLGSFKTTKILNKEGFFIRRFDESIKDITSARQYYELSQSLPRFFLETAIITVMLSLAMIVLMNGQSSKEIILTLSIFGMSGIRLLPSMNRILNALNSMKYSQGIIKELMEDLLQANCIKPIKVECNHALPVIDFQILKLHQISFSYTSQNNTLSQISLEIQANHSIGIVGHSGSGKSTLIDIMLGLIKPDFGEVEVNGEPLEDISKSWQKIIGYIPQDIYLSDDSIKANIAFGVELKNIDEKQLSIVIKTAQLEELVSSLEDGTDTIIGERGIKLSGGQRQRIGIARALYHEPQVLVMDEATAALDNATERDFMQAINNLKGYKTLIIIAHRITTIMDCDIIYVMDKGRIVDKGGYQKLNESSNVFRQLNM